MASPAQARVGVLLQHLPAPQGEGIAPFALDTSPAVMDDVRARLAATRWPGEVGGAGWDYGTDVAWLRRVCDHWAARYDWPARAARLNGEMPQFTVDVDGLRMHFVHKRCADASAPALVVTHGWPGSFVEFHKIIGPLTSGPQPFHVVFPSMPGYGYSEAPRSKGFDTSEVARKVHGLMLKLGYTRYFAQGGDWGSVVTRSLAQLFPGACAAVHVNMPFGRPPPKERRAPLTAAESANMAFMQQFQETETGYQRIQGTKPTTLAVGLNSSPAGLASWILEKFRAWSDCDGDPLNVYSVDELLDNIMVYWTSRCIGSSMRLYYETMAMTPAAKGNPSVKLRGQFVTVPTAMAQFAKEPFGLIPRSFAEEASNLAQWTEFASGGHFAALEKPEELVDDMRRFFYTVAPRTPRRDGPR